MKKSFLVMTSAVILISCVVLPLLAQQDEEWGKEMLFFDEMPMVTTASKRAQLITEAPATISVITAQDIKQSGARSIPEVLRMLPGVEIMQFKSKIQQVSIRGFIEPLSNKLLVLINGQSVYWDALGFVFWELFSISIEEIDRIEVIRGPSSSLYGANAFCGLINIITKTPDKLKGTQVNLSYGNLDTQAGSILHAGVSDKLGYKVSASWDRINKWSSVEQTAGEVTKGNALIEYSPGGEKKLSFSAGRNHFYENDFFAAESVGTAVMKGDFDNIQFDYESSSLKFRTFFKIEDAKTLWARTQVETPWYSTTFDADIHRSFDFMDKHSIVCGVNYRHNTIKENTFIPSDYSQDLAGLYIEEQYKIKDELTLTFGGRYDTHPLTDGNLSPRVNLSYSTGKSGVIRFSAGRAFRYPTSLESYMNYTQNGVTAVVPGVLEFPYTFTNLGSTALKPEGITSYEVECRTSLSSRIKSSFNLFLNNYSNPIISYRTISVYSDAQLLGMGVPGGYMPLLTGQVPSTILEQYVSGESAAGIGGEASFDVLINDRLSAAFNYSYLQITDKGDAINTSTVNEKDKVKTEFPQNKVNVSLKSQITDNAYARFDVHWVDKTTKLIKDVEGNEYQSDVDAYSICNLNLGCTVKEDIDVSMSVGNLFNNVHYEYHPGTNLPDISSDKIGRIITARVSCRF